MCVIEWRRVEYLARRIRSDPVSMYQVASSLQSQRGEVPSEARYRVVWRQEWDLQMIALGVTKSYGEGVRDSASRKGVSRAYICNRSSKYIRIVSSKKLTRRSNEQKTYYNNIVTSLRT